MGRPLPWEPAQIKEATRRRAQGATSQELADSCDRTISTMRRATMKFSPLSHCVPAASLFTSAAILLKAGSMTPVPPRGMDCLRCSGNGYPGTVSETS